ncbi:MAG: hypothetical protein EXS64_11115 [Candidatus Latescibacteria bacterium]|nr:hypothetical protein [Candidatus Latescibacterota bacterium]
MTELRNQGLAVEIDPADGTMAGVTNLLTGERYRVSAIPARILTDAGTIEPREAPDSRRLDSGIEYSYRIGEVGITVTYHLPSDRAFLERTIEVKNLGARPMVIHEVIAEEVQFSPGFVEVHPHRDPGVFAGLINVFLRGATGGFYFGAENPVYDQANKGITSRNTSIRLSYRPDWVLAAGASYRADPSFLGAYRREGIFLFREIGKLRRAVRDPKALPCALTFDPEVLDWGEVWAMQDFIRALQPAHDFRHPGYYVRTVAMVGGSTETGGAGWHVAFGPEHVEGSKRFVDDIVRLGHVPHIEWATEWFGLGGYSRPTPDLALEKAGPGQEVPVNPHWREVVQYGQGQEIDTGIFETVTRDFAQDRAAWKVLGRDGRPWTWDTPPRPVNCWANSDYVRWRLEVTDRAIRDWRLCMVAWDSAVPAYWAWLDWPGPGIACHAEDHGHLPGDIQYQVFRNILWFTGELQARHPEVALRVAAGTTPDYPWVLKHLIEYHPNLYDGETGATFWISNNFRFMPLYKSGVLLSATTDEGFKYLLLRSISASDHFMLWPDAVPIALKNRDFWDRWLTWADCHIAYLRAGRTLFREPWGDRMVASLPPALEGRLPAPEAGLNGSAHCIRDRGFLFLFNPSEQTRIGVVPIHAWIGLTEGQRFIVRERFPDDGRALGAYRRGEELRVAVGPEAAMVIEIAPAGDDAETGRPHLPPDAPVDRAFLRWEDIPWNEVLGE